MFDSYDYLSTQIAVAAQSIRNSKLRLDFLKSFASDPKSFVQTWLQSQSRDLDIVLGNEQGIKEEDLKNSQFFSEPWVGCHCAVGYMFADGDDALRLMKLYQYKKDYESQMRFVRRRVHYEWGIIYYFVLFLLQYLCLSLCHPFLWRFPRSPWFYLCIFIDHSSFS